MAMARVQGKEATVMKAILKILLLSAAGIAAFSLPALAADIIEAPYEEAPEVPVEISSGWYLRGDVSYDFKSRLKSHYRTYSSGTHEVGDYYSGGPDAVHDEALDGTTGDYVDVTDEAVDEVPVDYSDGTDAGAADCCATPAEEIAGGYSDEDYDRFRIDNSIDAGVGVGYQFTDYFRGDLTAHYWEADVKGRDTSSAGCGGTDLHGVDFPDGSTCRSQDKTKLSAWELMANAYVDVGNFNGITPYVGAGAGGVHVDYGKLTNKSYCVSHGADCGIAYGGAVDHDGADSWRFAYALMAGASYDLTRNLKIDVGYRYVNVDGGDMFDFDSATKKEGASGIQGKDHGFDRHSVQVGLRYSLF